MDWRLVNDYLFFAGIGGAQGRAVVEICWEFFDVFAGVFVFELVDFEGDPFQLVAGLHYRFVHA